MYPILHFKIFSIPTFGVIALIAFLFALWLIKFYASKEKFDYHRARNLFLYSAISAIAGSKLVGIIIKLPMIFENPKYLPTILISAGVHYGGAASMVLFLAIYCRYHKINVLPILDMFAPIGAIAMAIARWGCFASGCCFGKPTNVPWAVTFTNPIAHKIHPDIPDVPIHPTQIYLSLNSLIVFIILHILYRQKKFNGQIFFSYFLLYGIGRFFIEYFRFYSRGVIFGGYLTGSQLVAFISSFLSLLALTYLSQRDKKRRVNEDKKEENNLI